jgi:nucleoside-diphosphate-sugar epimerase
MFRLEVSMLPVFVPIRKQTPLYRDEWYPLSKLHAEEALSLYRRYMDVIIVRPFGIYGPGQKDWLVPNLHHDGAERRDGLSPEESLPGR